MVLGEATVKTGKKAILSLATDQMNEIIESGEYDLKEAVIYCRAQKMYWDQAEKVIGQEARAELDKYQGKYEFSDMVELSLGSTGVRKKYTDDPIYASLADQLKERKELLDLAFKLNDPVYDSEGVQVPKVSVATPSQETLVIRMK